MVELMIVVIIIGILTAVGVPLAPALGGHERKRFFQGIAGLALPPPPDVPASICWIEEGDGYWHLGEVQGATGYDEGTLQDGRRWHKWTF